jgi:RNA polymerase sigma-B factor
LTDLSVYFDRLAPQGGSGTLFGGRITMHSLVASDSVVRPRRAENLTTNDLALRWRERDDRWARDALFERYRPLARKLARRYSSSNEPFEDLAQVASVGLLGAIDRFDPRRGVTFTAFAVPTILGELKRYFRNAGWSVHVPRGAQEMALRVEQVSRQLAARTGHSPSVDEIAQYLEVDAEDVLAALEAGSAHYAISLDAPAAGPDPEQPEPLAACVGEIDHGYGLVEMSASLATAMTRLPYLERQALTMRLRENIRQSEIAERLGCSQMQVSRLLRRAGEKLRELTDPDMGL